MWLRSWVRAECCDSIRPVADFLSGFVQFTLLARGYVPQSDLIGNGNRNNGPVGRTLAAVMLGLPEIELEPFCRYEAQEKRREKVEARRADERQSYLAVHRACQLGLLRLVR